MKPILMSTLMAQAILAGRKTMTRRIIFKNTDYTLWSQPSFKGIEVNPQEAFKIKDGEIISSKNGEPRMYQLKGTYALFEGDQFEFDSSYIKAKYQKDDILWVRETWLSDPRGSLNQIDDCFYYKADMVDPLAFKGYWKPSIFMPKEAARIFLKVMQSRKELIHG